MITNERQYRMTKVWAEKFATGAASVEETGAELDPEMGQLYRNAYESQAEELRAQLTAYEAQLRQAEAIDAERRGQVGERN